MRAIAERLMECGLTMHPEKSRIVYCQDSNRTELYPHVQFTFLGFTFRPRKAIGKTDRVFTSFLPGVIAAAGTGAAYVAQALIDNLQARRAAKRECSISYILSLDD
jgi:hypothetical protein